MESSSQFTCLSYDTIDFLIQSRYVLFALYLKEPLTQKRASYEKEVLPHICIDSFLEKHFDCKPTGESSTMLVLKKDDFDADIQKQIVDYTETEFPVSGHFAVSVNSSVSSRIMDVTGLRLFPQGIRLKLNEYGLNAVGFDNHRQFLISPDNLLKQLMRGAK